MIYVKNLLFIIMQQPIHSRLVWTNGEPYLQSSRFQTQSETENKEPKRNDDSSALNPNPNQRREELDFKIAGREMFAQRGTNPFFTDSVSYADQVSIQSTQLQPIDTTQTDKSLQR